MLLSRRELLVVAGLTASCTTARHRPAPVDPDVTLVQEAVAREQLLLAAYDAALPHQPALQAFRDDHAAHLAALDLAAAPAAVAPAGDLTALERWTSAAHAADAARAAAPRLAQLLASLAACEASHAAVLP